MEQVGRAVFQSRDGMTIEFDFVHESMHLLISNIKIMNFQTLRKFEDLYTKTFQIELCNSETSNISIPMRAATTFPNFSNRQKERKKGRRSGSAH